MDALIGFFVGLALSAAVGFRVFVPLLLTGSAARLGYLELTTDMAWLASDAALVALATATVLEVSAYYVPWLDNLLDTVATPTAVVAGVIAWAAVTPELSPLLRWTLAVIAGGGAAGVVQSGTALLRLHSPAFTAGFGNPVVATGELAARSRSACSRARSGAWPRCWSCSCCSAWASSTAGRPAGGTPRRTRSRSRRASSDAPFLTRSPMVTPSGTLKPGIWLWWRTSAAIWRSIPACDVHDDVRLVGAPVPELAHLVGLEPFLGDVLGEVQVVAGVGVDRVGGGDAGLAVVAMLEAFHPVGVVHEDGVRPVAADGPDHVAQELARVLEPAVGVAEHLHVTHAHEVGGGPLLVGPLAGELGRGEVAVGGSRVAVGAQHVGHLAAGGHPAWR